MKEFVLFWAIMHAEPISVASPQNIRIYIFAYRLPGARQPFNIPVWARRCEKKMSARSAAYILNSLLIIPIQSRWLYSQMNSEWILNLESPSIWNGYYFILSKYWLAGWRTDRHADADTDAFPFAYQSDKVNSSAHHYWAHEETYYTR